MKANTIRRIACLGTGIIGAGWATNFVMKGLDVNLYDISDEQLELGRQRVKDNLDLLAAKGIISAAQVKEALSCLHCTSSLSEALADVQWIQESVPERYEIKQDVLSKIDEVVGLEVIYASSSSGLLISEIARFSKYPTRCICAHPYNPPHLIPLVELVGPEGSEESIQTAVEFFSSLGKEPVVLNKEVPGFIANRIQTAVAREIIDLVMNGVCSVEDADKALTFGPGIRWAIMGQNLLYNLGSSTGIKGLYANVGGGKNKKSWLDDMARWTKYPDGWPDIAQQGVDEAMVKRSPETGNSNSSLADFRDNMLMEILKLHNKL